MRTHLWEKTAAEGRSSLIPSGTVRNKGTQLKTIEKGLMILSPRFAGDVARLSRLENLVETKPYEQLHREWKQMLLFSPFEDIHSWPPSYL